VAQFGLEKVMGNVNIPQSAFLAALKMGDE
jgi:translation elongation factor EF-4